MFTTGLMHLHRAGKVTNARKTQFRGFSVATFALGTPELYEWIDGNDEVRFLPVDVVNAPHTISRNYRIVSLNGALGIDLLGQVAADRVGARQFSGIGGHEVVLVADACAALDEDLHRATLRNTAALHGRVATIDEVAAALGVG